MPTERADLATLNAPPLPSRPHRGSALDSARKGEGLAADLAEDFPSLAAPAREHMTSLSVRLPVSMAEKLERICSKHKIDKSALVRDGIASAITRIENASR